MACDKKNPKNWSRENIKNLVKEKTWDEVIPRFSLNRIGEKILVKPFSN